MSVTDLISQLKRDEGERLVVYLDSKGIPTAGVGHNLPAHGIDLPVGSVITQEQSDEWLDQDIAQATVDLARACPWSMDLDEAREGVLLNMCFNLGISGLLQFHHFIGKVQIGDWAGAAVEMLNSLWARQVGPRAARLAQQIRTGQWT